MCKDKLVLHLGVTLNNSSQIATWWRTDKMENTVTKAICVWCHKCKRNPWFAQQDVSLMNSEHLCGSVALESAWLCIFLTCPAAAENRSYLRSFQESITSSEPLQERERAVFCPIRRLFQHQLTDVTEPETTQCSSELARTRLPFPVLWYPSNKMWGSNWRYFFLSYLPSSPPTVSICY